MLQLKILHATTKTQHSQMNKNEFFKKGRNRIALKGKMVTIEKLIENFKEIQKLLA